MNKNHCRASQEVLWSALTVQQRRRLLSVLTRWVLRGRQERQSSRRTPASLGGSHEPVEPQD